jgi:hypothetical protein
MIRPALLQPRLVIRIASLLVPSQRREEWTREWLAELHYAQSHAGEAQSYAFARGAFHDAFWQQRDFWSPKRTARLAQSPWFCLAALATVLLLCGAASGLLPLTRLALGPLPYADAGRIVTIAQAATIGRRTGVLAEDVALWRASSTTLDGIATYAWDQSENAARVSDNFFGVLGAKTNFRGCGSEPGAERCVVLSYEYWRSHARPSSISIGGRPYRVAGVTERGFWFLSPKIALWWIESPAAGTRTGAVARLRPDATTADAQAELGAILRNAGEDHWESILEITGVESRVRFVFGVFGFSLVLAVVIVLPTLRLRIPGWNPRAAGFFVAKTGMLLAAVLLCGIEFTRASSITMLGGADGYTAVSAWLFVMGSTGALAWSIADQRQRCRVCLRRLGMAAYVGCTGCLLLDWAGTELVCVEGHGMLHVPEMVACWQEPDRWTLLDETWQELFERG